MTVATIYADGIPITLLNSNAVNALGFIPSFLSLADPRSAREQLDVNSRKNGCGGWHEMDGLEMRPNRSLSYSGDPPLSPFAIIEFRSERIYVYEFAFVAVVQPDGSFSVSRLD